MERRLYFLFPRPRHARHAVAELQETGIPRADIHLVARDCRELEGTPVATEAQQTDRVWWIERLYWNINLAVFFAALAALGLALWADRVEAALAALAVMLLTFVTGERFAVRVPHAHLAEQRVPLRHGEVVVMVDVPASRVREIEQLIERLHPEVGIGGVGWHLHGASF
jgi:hypothetical protein